MTAPQVVSKLRIYEVPCFSSHVNIAWIPVIQLKCNSQEHSFHCYSYWNALVLGVIWHFALYLIQKREKCIIVIFCYSKECKYLRISVYRGLCGIIYRARVWRSV